MHPRIEQVLQLGQETHSKWDAVFATLRDSGLSLDRNYPTLQECSLNELNERLLATLAMLSALRNIDEGATSLLLPRIQPLTSSLTQVGQHAESVNSSFAGYQGSTFTDNSGNLSIQVNSAGSVVTTFSIASAMEGISSAQMVLADQLTIGLRFGRFKGAGLFQETAKELQNIAKQMAELLAVAKEKEEELNGLNKRLVGLETASIQRLADIDKVKDASQASNTTAQQQIAEIEAKLIRVKEITKNADALSTSVEAYDADFQAFQDSLSTRTTMHEKFEKEAASAMAENKKRESTIDGLINKADTMIRGATTAGLSSSLETTKDDYEKRLKITGRWFLGSVIVLLVCLIPIAGQIVPGPWQEWFKVPAGASSDPWLATLGKVVLLIPATWATAFFAGNYAELFHLSREYAHKAALAKAVDGFKREAPEYKEEIVAGVFMEIQDNPGSRKAPAVATPQNPIAQRILNTLLEAIKAKKNN